MCSLDSSLNIEKYSTVDTTKLDVPPLWEFVGLEDCRLVFWDNKLFCVEYEETQQQMDKVEWNCLRS